MVLCYLIINRVVKGGMIMKRYAAIGILLMLLAPGCGYDKAAPEAYMSKPAAEKIG